MFFSIGKTHQENYSHFWKLGEFSVSTDAGWKSHSLDGYQLIYKGYRDDASLEDTLESIVSSDLPFCTGNYCVLVYNNSDNSISIKTDLYRSFPIYIHPNRSLDNLIPSSRIAWTDSLCSINRDLTVTEKKFDVIGPESTCSLSSTVNDLHNYLSEKIQKFADNNRLPLKVFLSGGIDTMLVFSYILKLNISYEIVRSYHIDHDDFFLANSGNLKKFWGYQQIHHWHHPCVLASGTPGDEFMMRSPTTANLYLLNNGTSIPELMEKNKQCLHHRYFSKESHQKIFESQEKNFHPSNNLVRDLCNIIVNDWQHWHIGQTLTWTPLRDLQIFKMISQMPFEDICGQIADSLISKQLIEFNQPQLLDCISDEKNCGNPMANLRNLYQIIQKKQKG